MEPLEPIRAMHNSPLPVNVAEADEWYTDGYVEVMELAQCAMVLREG